MSMNRNFRASLSPQEIDALRRLKSDPRQAISVGHRFLLLSMGLVVSRADGLRLTEAGHERLAMEDGEPRRERRAAAPRPTIH